MSSKTTFAEISPSELGRLYKKGLSISEIMSQTRKSYSYTRGTLVEAGVSLRSKAEGTRLYASRHPEWSKQFVKYYAGDKGVLTEAKVLLLGMVVTEGYTDEDSFGFTNSQIQLHNEFASRVKTAYGEVHIGRNRLTSRISSTEIARDISHFLPQKAFSDEALAFIVRSQNLTAGVLRVIADTEGAFIISIKKAKHNHTVESRIVLASSNPKFTAQISFLLGTLGIESRTSPTGIILNRKSQIAGFIKMVGFSPGIRVIRRRGGLSTWYGVEKAGLQSLFLKVSTEQKVARALGLRGCFADCTTREQTLRRLLKWYAEVNGGGES